LRINGVIVDAVSIFVGGRTGANPKAGEKIMELVPVDDLDEIVPVIIRNLNTLRNLQRDHQAEERILMVPALAIN